MGYHAVGDEYADVIPFHLFLISFGVRKYINA